MIRVIWRDAQFDNARVVGYIVFITLALVVLRFAWIFLLSEGQRLLERRKPVFNRSLRAYTLISLSGVRGVVTLAGTLSIPLVLENGSAFPRRDLMIFIAAGVILLTLLMESFLLPLIAEKKETGAEADQTAAEKEAKVKLIKAVMHSVQGELTEENREAALSVISDYRRLLAAELSFSST